jgi:N6-L-threonylcarbamoyladenine synthase
MIVRQAHHSARILGIETSCDETAAAIVEDGRRILSNVVASQIDLHRQYGGVFPEMASRQHILTIMPVIQQALRQSLSRAKPRDSGQALRQSLSRAKPRDSGQALTEAELDWDDLDAIAVTYGPGLPGSLLVGVNTAKGLAYGRGLPLLGINHIEAHIYANWLVVDDSAQEISFPLLALVVSGGHTELILMTDHGQYQRLGHTLDDAAGEAFDKVGRLLGLEFPGGPAIERVAQEGNPLAFKLPRAWLKGTYNFSFSGLKTAVLRIVQKYEGRVSSASADSTGNRRIAASQTPSVIRPLPVANLAASFQASVIDVLVEKTRMAAEEHQVKLILLAGGVAANRLLCQQMAERSALPVLYPPPALCTDNAAMIASAGYFRYQAGHRSGWDLDVISNLRLA